MAIVELQVTALAGWAVSLYSYALERKTTRNKGFKAFCDISDRMSCTKAFTSEYGRIVGVSNALLGALFYAALFALSFFAAPQLLLVMAIGAVLGSVALAYIAYFKMRNFCLLCNIIYAINLLLLYFAYALLTQA